MQARASADDNRDTRTTVKQAKLDECYGKIGIRAVAGAVHRRGEERKASRSRFVPQESD